MQGLEKCLNSAKSQFTAITKFYVFKTLQSLIPKQKVKIRSGLLISVCNQKLI